MDFSNDSREDLESMATELYEKYDEIDSLNKKVAELEKNVVNKDLRWGLIGTKINYSWLWTSMTERYDEDNDYDFEQDLRKSDSIQSDSIQSISLKEYGICTKLGNQIEKHINCGKCDEIENDINDAISELAELYIKKE